MSIIKIQGVRRLDKAVNYIKQNHKAEDNLITTFDCDENYVVEDFEELHEERLDKLRKETNNKAKMVIQAFDNRDNLTPEKAHEIGIEFANNYLKGNHQFIIATHTDTDNIHNHIIFNQVRSDNLLMFDTSRKKTITNLRLKNDKLSKKYGLNIPKKKNKIPYISQKEYATKVKGNSFKEKLENTIDEVIKESESYDEFIIKMDQLGYKNKEGKYLAFLNEKSNKFMRSKTLGINYNRNSIKYRIENKDFKIHKFKYTLSTEKIDKSKEKFKKNYGLRKWATKKNIAHLQEVSDLVFNKKMSLDEIESIKKDEESFMKDIENAITGKDILIQDLSKKENAFQDFKDSASLIAEYKKADNKKEFKSNHYAEFKKFDKAKRNMYLLKRDHGISSEEELLSLKDDLKEERKNIFVKYTKFQIEKENEKEKEKEKEIEKVDNIKKEKTNKKHFRR